MKSLGSTEDVHWILAILSPGEGGGIPSVEVKFVDIGRNTGGEGGHLHDLVVERRQLVEPEPHTKNDMGRQELPRIPLINELLRTQRLV